MNADKVAEIQQSLGISHTRGPSHAAYPMTAPTSSGLHSAPPVGDEYRDQVYGQMGVEGFTPVNFNSISSGNQSMGAGNKLQGEYAAQALQFMQQQQPQLPSTFQFTQPNPNNQPVNFNAQNQNQRPVHFIANTQKFYGISPERAQQLLFNTGANPQGIMAQSESIGGSGEKRPFTAQQLSFMNSQLPTSASAGPNSTVFNKRQSNAAKAAQQHQMITQLYLGGAPPHKNNFMQNSEPQAPRSQNIMYSDLEIPQPPPPSATHYGGFNMSSTGNKKLNSRLAGIMGTYGQTAGIQNYSQSVPRKPGTSGSMTHTTNKRIIREQEQLYEEVMRLKQLANVQREENVKLKTKVKVLENDMLRKERTLEDFFQQQQFIAQSGQKPATQLQEKQATNSGATAQRYQQETFLVMSLKKQIKELKSDLCRRDEEIALNKRNVRHTKFYEMETEIKIYRDELARLRFILEQTIGSNSTSASQQQCLNLHDQSSSAQRINGSALSNHFQNTKPTLKQTELKNSFSEPPTGKNIQPLTESQIQNGENNLPDRLEVVTGNDISALSEQIDINVPQERPVKSNSGLKGTSMERQKREQNELKNKLTFAQRESTELAEKSKAQSKELQRVKKALKDREAEMKKLKQDVTTANENKQKTVDESKEQEKKQMATNKKAVEMRVELKQQQDQIDKLSKEVKAANEKAKTQGDKFKKDQVSAIKSLEAVIQEQQAQLKKKDEEKVELMKKKDEEKVELMKKNDQNQEESDKQQQIQEILSKSLEQLSLISEQICYKSKTDRVECAEILFMAANGSPDKEYEGLEQFIDCSIKELVKLVTVQELACLLPRCRSNILTNQDKDELLNDLRKEIPNEKIDKILKQEEKNILTLEEIQEALALSDKIQTRQRGELCKETAYRLIQILYFVDYTDGTPKFDILKLAKDIKKSQIRSMSVGLEKSVILDKEEAKTPDVMSSAETLSSRYNGRRRSSVDDERMLDVAEGCFIRLSELLMEQGRTVRGIFTKFSQPEVFPDNTVLELLSPMSFLAGVREAGFLDLQEVEAACLMKVLSKPELENHIILNELVLIMENFGVPDNLEDDEEDDFVPDSATDQEEEKDDETDQMTPKPKKEPKSKMCNKDTIDEKGVNILTKLACFLLKQFVHPREFFGQAIKKSAIQTKKKMYKVDTLTFKEFYLRIKIASIRKKLTPNDSLNNELCVDSKKYSDMIHVKSLVRILEEIAEAEQEKMMREQEANKEEGNTPTNLNIDHTIDSDSVVTPKTNDSGSKQKDGMKPLDAFGDNRPVGIRNNPVSKSQDSEEGKVDKEMKKLTRSDNDYKEGGDLMKFGHTKLEGSFSAGRGNKTSMGPKVELCTIEEDKAETQTSHYAVSERQDSSLMGNTQIRGSNMLHDNDFPESEQKPKCRSFSNMSNSDTEKGSPAAQSMKFNNSSGKSDKQKAKLLLEKPDNLPSNFNAEPDQLPQIEI